MSNRRSIQKRYNDYVTRHNIAARMLRDNDYLLREIRSSCKHPCVTWFIPDYGECADCYKIVEK